MLLEDFGDEAVVLAQVEVALFGGDDAGGVWGGKGGREGWVGGWVTWRKTWTFTRCGA
jgi:hypothetical protein